MIIAYYSTIFLAAVITITAAVTENVSNSELSNDIEDAKEKKLEIPIATTKLGDSDEQIRRSRYLRQIHRPKHRLPPSFTMKNSRRPWKHFNSFGKFGNSLNNFNHGPHSPQRNRNNHGLPPPHLFHQPKYHYNNGPFPRPWPTKGRYGNGKHNWRNKWPPESSRYPPSMNYVPMGEDDNESFEEYPDIEEYGNFDDEGIEEGYTMDDVAETGMYGDVDEDAVPVSSKYSEKRSPFKYIVDPYSSYADSSTTLKGHGSGGSRIKFNRDENASRNNNFHRKYRLSTTKSNRYQEPVTMTSRNRDQSHRFRVVNLSGLKMLQNNDGDVITNDDIENEDDQYDFSNTKAARYNKHDHSTRFNEDNSVRYESNNGQSDSSSKYFGNEAREENVYTAKRQTSSTPQNIQDVVYSSKYRNNHSQIRSGEDEYSLDNSNYPATSPKRNVFKKSVQNKVNTVSMTDMDSDEDTRTNKNFDNDSGDNVQTNLALNNAPKEVRQRWVSKNKQPSSSNNDSNQQHTITPVSENHSDIVKSDEDHLLPSELIAYMSVNPSEPVINKEERFNMASYPFVRTFNAPFFKSLTSPLSSDQDVEINLDQYTSEWKNQLLV